MMNPSLGHPKIYLAPVNIEIMYIAHYVFTWERKLSWWNWSLSERTLEQQ